MSIDESSPKTNEEGIVATVIPYHNPPALIGYYLTVFSFLGIIPLIGIIGTIMAIAGVILGFVGLRKVKENPACRGTGHSWFCIIAGSLIAILTGIEHGFILFAMFMHNH